MIVRGRGASGTAGESPALRSGRGLAFQNLIYGLNIYQAVASVDCWKNLGGWVLAAEFSDFDGAGTIGGQVHAAE